MQHCDTLIIPGIGNSGSQHWQSIWETNDHACRRIIQDDWDNPLLSVWTEKLDSTIAHLKQPAVLVAHSLGCLLVAHWATTSKYVDRIHAALLVAVPDPTSSHFPKTAVGFEKAPLSRLPFQTIVVASNTDPYATISFANNCADAWGGTLLDIGDAGHINASSGLGDWQYGYGLLKSLRETAVKEEL